MKSLPIRIKFALWSGLAMALALGVLAMATLFNLYRDQIQAADEEILVESQELQTLLSGKLPETIQWTLDPHLGWTVFDEQGQMLREDPLLTENAARPALSSEGIVSSITPGKRWRVQAFETGPRRTIVVGYDMVKVNEVLGALVLAYVWSLPLVVIVVVIGSWWVTGRALAPFNTLATAIEGIKTTHLERHQRVPVHPARDEIQRLATSFNALLARFEKSFTQTKRFASDASHELRTPLTIMKGEVERLLTQSDLPPETATVLVSLQDEIARLIRISEQLLELARFDAGQIEFQTSRVDYSMLLAEVCEDAELLASAAGVTLEVKHQDGLHGMGDALQLRRLFLNLLDNACKYNRADGQIQCRLARGDGTAILRIGNTGPGIPVDLRERVFERFFQADASRSSTGGHGLGLALCWEIAELHRGHLSLSDNCGSDWTEFEVTLPTV